MSISLSLPQAEIGAARFPPPPTRRMLVTYPSVGLRIARVSPRPPPPATDAALTVSGSRASKQPCQATHSRTTVE